MLTCYPQVNNNTVRDDIVSTALLPPYYVTPGCLGNKTTNDNQTCFAHMEFKR